MVIFSENPRISFPVNMSPKVFKDILWTLRSFKISEKRFDCGLPRRPCINSKVLTANLSDE